ncbi:MAG: DUF1653 domain-containing protein [Lachnospiraceae bacterium]|nr:DUF1653 domain-containing protein [Lachnospiraceae bacterium]
MRDIPKPQEIYRHFKGNLYQIITIAKDSETGVKMVIYQALYGDFAVWCRELNMFLSEVDRTKYPDAQAKYRFTRVEAVEKQDGGPKPSPEKETVVTKTAPVRDTVMSKTIEEEAAELHMDPLVVAFLDADSATDRIRVLEELRGKATNEMIDIMAMAAGLDIEPGEPWDRFGELRDCLRTIERFETTRLRY